MRIRARFAPRPSRLAAAVLLAACAPPVLAQQPPPPAPAPVAPEDEAELRRLNGLGPGSQPGEGHSLLVPDGIDPDGALEVTSLLPFAATAARQPGLKLNTSQARSGEPHLKSPKARPRPGEKRSTKRSKKR